MPTFENVTPTRIEIPAIGAIVEAGQVVELSAEAAAIIGDSHPDLTPSTAAVTAPVEEPVEAPAEPAAVEENTNAADAATTKEA